RDCVFPAVASIPRSVELAGRHGVPPGHVAFRPRPGCRRGVYRAVPSVPRERVPIGFTRSSSPGTSRFASRQGSGSLRLPGCPGVPRNRANWPRWSGFRAQKQSNTMAYESITVTPVTPRIGANVEGIVLSKPLSNRQVEELHQALAQHQVLFFRDQLLDVQSHKRFGRYFGELHIHPSTPGPEGHPEILPIHADANSKRIAGEYWHSDVSCDPEPPMGSILCLHTVP